MSPPYININVWLILFWLMFFFLISDWQLYYCRDNQWHSKSGSAHLIKCVWSSRALHKSVRRKLHLCLPTRIHWDILSWEWVILHLNTHHYYSFIAVFTVHTPINGGYVSAFFLRYKWLCFISLSEWRNMHWWHRLLSLCLSWWLWWAALWAG